MQPLIKAHRAGFPLGTTWITRCDAGAEAGDGGDLGIAVGVLRLATGEEWETTLSGETAFLLMEGRVRVEAGEGQWRRAAELCRDSIFDEAPSGIHAPAGTRVRLVADALVEFTLYGCRNQCFFPPYIFREVTEEQRGKGLVDGACHRLVRTIIDRSLAPIEAELVLGEVVTRPGRWAGYPPHSHVQPEIYHYRFDHPQGFGYSELGEQVFRVQNFDTVQIAGGLEHPQVAAPGYVMYFSWVIRHLPERPYLAPDYNKEHAWVTDPCAIARQPAGLQHPGARAAPRSLDLICMGRVAVDLYGEQRGSRLEDVASFAKYVGGCAGNIAIGAARQGLRTAMLSRVGSEQMGRFVRETLRAERVDVSHLKDDPERLTGLAILAIKSRDEFPLLFYRENCADMALAERDFDAEFIASAKALLVTGTLFSNPATERTARSAMALARSAGTKIVLDIDYRPVLWGLTSRGDGETRYISSPQVSARLMEIVADCQLVVGTEEEFHIAGGVADTHAALLRLRRVSDAVFLVKRGPAGCLIFAADIPDTLDAALAVPGARVNVLNVLGAGDAFMAGFLRGWLEGEPLERCGLYGNLAGGLVVARHGCAPAMPIRAEMDAALSRAAPLDRPDADEAIAHLHWAGTRRGDWEELMVLAFDHRNQFETMADQAGCPRERISDLKLLIARAACRVAAEMPGRAGVLVDGRYGQPALDLLADCGLWVGRPVESSGVHPLAFEDRMNVGLALRQWPREHVVKCLVQFRAEAGEGLQARQEGRILGLHRACMASDHELLLEVIAPAAKDSVPILDALKRIYKLGVRPDWWKLPPLDATGWREVEALVRQHDPLCRGILLLGQDASVETLRQAFIDVAGCHLVRGFAVGRTIIGAPSRAWFEGGLSDEQLVKSVATRYGDVIRLWKEYGRQRN